MANAYLNRDRVLTLLVVLVVSAVLGTIVFRSAVEYERERVIARSEKDLLARASALVHEIGAKAEVLHALRTLYENSEEVTREEFESMGRDAISRHPAIHALEWTPRVPDDQRASHEAQAQRDGYAGYRITESRRHGDLVGAATRSEYYPVYHVIPRDGNEPAIGFDLASDPMRKSFLLRAMKSGELTLTDPLDLVQLPGANDGVLAFLPVFSRRTEVPASRREVLQGFVLAVFCFEELFEPVLADLQLREQLHVELYDEDVNGEPRSLYASAGAAIELTDGRVHRHPIEFGGQRWLLVGEPTPAYLQAQHTYQPAALGIGVFLITPLLVGFMLAQAERTHASALRGHVEILRSILRSLSEGVIVANRQGRFILANNAARTVVGAVPEYVPPSDWAKTFGLHLPDGETLYPAEQLPLARAIRGEETSEAEVVVRNPAMPQGAWLSVNGSPLIDDSGAIRGGVVVFRDISMRKQAEQHLLRLSNAVEQTADAVFITDRSGTIEYANPAVEALTGYAPNEILGGNPSILSSGRQSPGFYERLWETILEGRVFRAPIVNRKKSGKLFDAEITISPVFDSGEQLTHFVSVMKDMTERKRILEQDFEMRMASKVQLELYPQQSPKVSGFDIDGIVVPADATCGDYFDYIGMAQGTLGLVIGDVSGHGFGPALIMSQTRAYLRMVAQSIIAPAEVLLRTNEVLSEDLEDNRFVTLLFARLDPATGGLDYANAGHTDGYVLDRSGRIKQELKSTGPPLGMFRNAAYSPGPELELQPGELLVFLTDGVVEAENPDGEFFGIGRALDVVAQNRNATSQEIANRVQWAVRSFTGTGSLRDDLTLVLCKRNDAG